MAISLVRARASIGSGIPRGTFEGAVYSPLKKDDEETVVEQLVISPLRYKGSRLRSRSL